jgi:hypothetical protein
MKDSGGVVGAIHRGLEHGGRNRLSEVSVEVNGNAQEAQKKEFGVIVLKTKTNQRADTLLLMKNRTFKIKTASLPIIVYTKNAFYFKRLFVQICRTESLDFFQANF